MHGVINDAAVAYRGVIPADRWHEPYMPMSELEEEVGAGVLFWGMFGEDGLEAVMGLQHVQDVALVRHAYTRTSCQGRGLGKALLRHVLAQTDRPVLIGTWKAAAWAIGFYQGQGFVRVDDAAKPGLLRKYWSIPARQVEESVVLADAKALALIPRLVPMGKGADAHPRRRGRGRAAGAPALHPLEFGAFPLPACGLYHRGRDRDPLPHGAALRRSAKMTIDAARDAVSRIFYQRCFWLFMVLLVLIGAVSFVPPSDNGRLVLNAVNMFVLIATVAAVGRTKLSFVIALLLALPAVYFQYLGLWNDSDSDLAKSWMFSATLYFVSNAYLLRYVFQPRIMTQDKLFGAAALYLTIGLFWAYLYAIIGYFHPHSYMILGQPGKLVYADALYLSITVLTSTGFGDVTPLTRAARGVCMIEQISGALFIAILIARLAGVYPPRESYVDDRAA